MKSMTELLEIQREINGLMGAYPDSPVEVGMAIIQSCGRVSTALAAKWRWWSWEGERQEFDRAVLIEELAGVLKYLLVGAIASGNTPINPNWIADAEYCWELWVEMPFQRGEPESLSMLVSFSSRGEYGSALRSLVAFCAYHRVSREQLTGAYLKKIDKVRQRLHT